MRRIVILGAGTAGTLIANKLRRAYPPDVLQLTLIDSDDNHHYQPGYLFLPFGQLAPRQIVRPRHVFVPDGVDLILCGARRIEADTKTVQLNDGRVLPYDTLVLATGVRPRPDLTEGGIGPETGRSVHQFYTLEGAAQLQEAVRRFEGGRFVVHITEMPIKCPVAPLEFIFLADAYFREKKIRRKVDITYVTPLDGAFTKPVASRELANALTNRGIALETDCRSSASTRRQADHQLRRPADRLRPAGHRAAQHGCRHHRRLRPWRRDEPRAVRPGHRCGRWPTPTSSSSATPAPLQTSKAGSVAHVSADVFMENSPQYLAGRQLTHQFDGHANCFIESGAGKGMLLDFNYATQPYTGVFPLPVIGPMSLLKETRLNHWAKVAFRWVYWNLLITGRPIPIPTAMSMVGKNVEKDDAPGRHRETNGRPPRRTPLTRWSTSAIRHSARRGPIQQGVMTVPTTMIDGRPIKVNDEGFLTSYDEWDEHLGAALAGLIGMQLTDEHWAVLRFLRSDYLERNETATLRRVSKVGGFDMAAVRAVPTKPAKKMAWLAGLPKPKGCV